MNTGHSSQFAVIFDMDGVIVHSNPTHKKAIRKFLEQHGKSLSDRYLREEVYGRTNREWLRSTFDGITEEKIEEYIREKEQIFREMFAHDLKPLPGLREFLDTLCENEIIMAVATSAPKVNADWVLGELDLVRYFRTVLHEGHVTHGKPHPEIYLKTADALDMEPEKCVIFEDSLSGVEAARSAGSPVIGVTTTHTREELAHTDAVIRDFTEIDSEILISIYDEAVNRGEISNTG